ncbi:hypothetical protein K1X09_25845 [Paenibacillus lautus]|nr:hypothetical protein [Paenibacillus lautus]
MDTVHGIKKISELIEFVHNEYAQLMKGTDSTMEPDIKIKGILDFISDNGGAFYQLPEKAENEEKKNKMLDSKELGKRVGKEFAKIGHYFASSGYVFDEQSASKWLDGSGNGIRDYFWIEHKLPEKISLKEIAREIECDEIAKELQPSYMHLLCLLLSLLKISLLTELSNSIFGSTFLFFSPYIPLSFVIFHIQLILCFPHHIIEGMRLQSHPIITIYIILSKYIATLPIRTLAPAARV